MPKYKVLCRVDAYVDYTAVVEAGSPEAAAELARDNAGAYAWKELGAVEFDARGYVTLNSRGGEIERSRTGYFG
jgi:hypothetical protein